MRRRFTAHDGGVLRPRPDGIRHEGGSGERLVPGTHSYDVDGERIGLLHVPRVAPDEGKPWALVVLFHGAGADADDIISLLATPPQREPTLVLAPDAVATTWDLLHGGTGADAWRLDAALEALFAEVMVSAECVAVAGFSDGASYALSIGLANGSLFQNVIAFSPGFMAPSRIDGQPRVFMSHGTRDRVLSIDRCSRVIVPRLRTAGYDVEYREFDGGHAIPEPIVERSLAWLSERPVRT